MSEETPAPDLVELGRHFLEAASRGDFDVMLSFFAPNAVWDTLGGLGTFEGHGAIRGFWEDWYSTYEEFEIGPEEILDLGNGVTFAVLVQKGRPVGSGGDVRHRNAGVVTWMDGMIVRVTFYSDIDEARAAAERLAKERGLAMSENLDLVRSIYAAWERGDFNRADWAHPEIEYMLVDGPAPFTRRGLSGLAEGWREFLSAWEDFRVENVGYRQLDSERVLMLDLLSGRGTTSGVELGQMQAKGASLFHVRGGKVTRIVTYWNRDRALADLGLAE